MTALCPGPTESGFQSAAEMEASRLVKGRKLPTSAEVAAFGYQAMMKGELVSRGSEYADGQNSKACPQKAIAQNSSKNAGEILVRF